MLALIRALPLVFFPAAPAVAPLPPTIVAVSEIQGDEHPPPLDPKEVAQATRELRTLFEEKEPAELAAALQSAPRLPHEDVIAVWVKEGLAHERADVRRASIEALGTIAHPDALSALHTYKKRHKKELEKDPEQLVTLLKAIALHGSESSIDLLVDGIFTSRNREVTQARILALGKIRSPKAVEAIFSAMRKIDRRKVQPRMKEIRLALLVLTHVDRGTRQESWVAWWNENKKNLRVPEEEPRLAKEDAVLWARFWGEPRPYQRQKRRTRRGRDGEGDQS